MKSKILEKIITSVSIFMGTVAPTQEEIPQDKFLLKVVEQKELDYQGTISNEWYGSSEGKKSIRVTMENDNGNKLFVTTNDWKKCADMWYYKDDVKISYHYHDMEMLKKDIELHQENLRNNFKDWEMPSESTRELRESVVNDYSNEIRKSLVNSILHTNKLESDGWTFYSPYQDQWFTLTEEEQTRAREQRSKDIESLKVNFGFDINNNIDYTVILGRDWKCQVNETSGKVKIEQYLKTRE